MREARFDWLERPATWHAYVIAGLLVLIGILFGIFIGQ